MGVQSTWLLVMAGLGMIEPIDAAVVADTQWERRNTIETFEFYKAWAKERGIKVEVVSAGNIKLLGAENHIHIPFFSATGAPLKRQCTKYFKLVPLRRIMRHLAGYDECKPPHPKKGEIECLIGISYEEWDRMSTSRVGFIVHSYPLVEQKISRWDCEDGFKRIGLPVPVKSACIGCPYRDANGWMDMKNNDPDEFEEACQFDEKNRHNPKTKYDLFIWRGLIPLREVDFEVEATKVSKIKQNPLFICTGNMCWT
jgi:hypothetical protein